MAESKKLQAEQAKQLAELLKHYGISTPMSVLSARERRKIERLFPD